MSTAHVNRKTRRDGCHHPRALLHLPPIALPPSPHAVPSLASPAATSSPCLFLPGQCLFWAAAPQVDGFWNHRSSSRRTTVLQKWLMKAQGLKQGVMWFFFRLFPQICILLAFCPVLHYRPQKVNQGDFGKPNHACSGLLLYNRLQLAVAVCGCCVQLVFPVSSCWIWHIQAHHASEHTACLGKPLQLRQKMGRSEKSYSKQDVNNAVDPFNLRKCLCLWGRGFPQSADQHTTPGALHPTV